MSGHKIFVDTNILLYFLKGEEEVIQILADKEIVISFITELELLSFPGISTETENVIKGLLTNCTIIGVSNEIKTSVIKLRKNYKTKIPDAIIAATSLDLNLPLFTADKHLVKIKPLEIILYEF